MLSHHLQGSRLLSSDISTLRFLYHDYRDVPWAFVVRSGSVSDPNLCYVDSDLAQNLDADPDPGLRFFNYDV